MASLRRIRRNSCTGKRRYLTAQEGQEAIFWLNRRRGYQGRMDVYRCRFCNGYHIGHSKGKGRV